MKRKLLALVLAALTALALLTGCGGGSAPAKTEAQSAPAAESAAPAEESAAAASAAAESAQAASAAAESTAAEASQGSETAAPASPYAWLGLQDMPSCPYLDALCTYHYYREYTSYVSGYAMKNTEAMDGANTFKGTDTTRTYSIDGSVISFNDSSKTYMKYDMGSGLTDQANENIEKNQADGTNMIGRVFVTTGTGTIPEYSEVEDDQTEYEYYEYNYPSYEEFGTQLVERFYMKDGDVYAIYQETYSDGKLIAGMTEVIHSMSGEIPEGTFDTPSTDGYEEIKLGDD